jgi:N-acetylated-alpha-linked acidic dipeptidase
LSKPDLAHDRPHPADRPRASWWLAARVVATAALSIPFTAAAQAPIGFSADRQAALEAAEAIVVATPSPDSARRHSRELTREAHVAGTPAQLRTARYVADEMRRWGFKTEIRRYDVWMPHVTQAGLWLLHPKPAEFPLREPPLDDDQGSEGWQYPTVNGYSGTGDVTADVVFVNYGLMEDYATLDSMGVDVAGKIVIARYGRSFRGIKAREAERHGAAGLILYSDPQDDGYVRGDVYPEGPMRPPGGVQRGSVMNGIGDPSTPGYASVAGAPRLPLDQLPVPRIPVVAVGYGIAASLLEPLRGGAIPQSWQGGLPFRYHVGPGPARARILVEDDRATRGYKEIYNTVTTVRGTDLADELVLIGAHRDAWSPGAVDNVSGTASVLEAARAVAAAIAAGHRPRRTIVFATWDAEEWGIIGSTEHVEEDSVTLWRNGVAYLNQDAAASGPRFGAGGSPSLRALLRDVARRVPHPAGGTVYEKWRLEAAVPAGAEPAMGDPGGGSDFAAFYNHLGIPHADWGFGGPGGIYHSQYDSFAWMSRYGDPEFTYHATAARVGAAMLLRLASADVVPFDYAEFAETMQQHLEPLSRQLDASGATDLRVAARVDSLRAAVGRMADAARAFAVARDERLDHAGDAGLIETNAELRAVERAFTRMQGLRSRPWFRTLTYASDEDNGYATVVFPSVREALKSDDRELLLTEMADLADRFDEATAALRRATAQVSRRR